MRDEKWFNVDFIVINLEHQKAAKARALSEAQLRILAREAQRENRGQFMSTFKSLVRKLFRIRIIIKKDLVEASGTDLAAQGKI